ncbi:GAF domain-containing sensor histidine kinase [Gracilimonas halophila]|uniref:histidine kinase n=1 Tax=Gracilimonas halophila TaxID=1834464 RepID=A0ABW5JLN1_9BACT
MINDLHNVQDIAHAVTNNVINLLGYEDCIIYTVNENESTLQQIAAYGPKAANENTVNDPLSIPIGSNVVGKVAQTGEPIIIHDTDEVEDYLVDDKKRHSEITVPIKVNSKVIGIIDSENSRKNFYTESDLITLTTIANLISLKLDKALQSQRSAKDILELQEILKLMLSHSKSAIMMEDWDQKILTVNQAFCDAFDENLTPYDFEGLSTLDFADKLSETFLEKDAFIERIKQLKSDNEMVLNEQIKTRNDKYYSRDFIPVKINNKTKGYYWQYNDITDTIKSKNMVERSLNLEKKNNLLNKNLISIASHELRTPITSIKSTIDLVLSNAYKYNKEQIIHRLDRIKRASDNMSLLLDDIMTLGKLDNFELKDHEEISITLDDLKDIIKGINEDHMPNRKVIIQDTGCKSLSFTTYKNKLYLIIKNLLSNADKYSNPELPIQVSINTKSSRVEISISDKGIGIPKDQQDKIFRSFTRGSNVAETKGTGLGLAIVKRSLDILNGTMSIKSSLNKGTKVILNLPIE